MKTKTKIKSVKKTAKSNIIKIPRKKNVSLDKKPDGTWNTSIDYYNQDPERQVSTDDAVMLLNNLVSKSTLERNRRDNKDDNGSRGPQYRKLTERVVIYKILWLMRFREGLAWIKVQQELKPSYAVTATNIPSSNVVGMKKNY